MMQPPVSNFPFACVAVLTLMLGTSASSQATAADMILERAVAFDPYPSQVEQIYQERLRAYKQGPAEGEVRGGLRSYEPTEPVAGVSEPRPLSMVAAGQAEVSTLALDMAREYAGRMNSSALMVWHKGQLVEESYFGGVEHDTPIVSRSLAKPITALAVGRAIQLGHIRSLDQPVAEFITEWAGDRRSAILVRHLLDMRSGLLPQGFSDDPLSIYTLTYLHPHHDELLVNHYPLTDEPGTRYEYSNATSELVAVLIERATGVRYHEWVAREVLQQIQSPGGRVWVNREGGVAHSGCCILLPAEAWLRMGVLLLGEGAWSGKQLLDPGFVNELRTGTQQNPHAGMGVFVAGPYVERRGSFHPDIERSRALHSEPYLAADLFLFDGYGNQVVYVIPSYDLVILRTGDSPPRNPEWDNSFLPNTIMRGIPMENRPPSQLP
jgi:CubicO group peptidase (beta-lactamase class C family)